MESQEPPKCLRKKDQDEVEREQPARRTRRECREEGSARLMRDRRPAAETQPCGNQKTPYVQQGCFHHGGSGIGGFRETCKLRTTLLRGLVVMRGNENTGDGGRPTKRGWVCMWKNYAQAQHLRKGVREGGEAE